MRESNIPINKLRAILTKIDNSETIAELLNNSDKNTLELILNPKESRKSLIDNLLYKTNGKLTKVLYQNYMNLV